MTPTKEQIDAALTLVGTRCRFFGAGEADCPPDIKAANGELWTMRCRVCGGSGRDAFCGGAKALAQLLADREFAVQGGCLEERRAAIADVTKQAVERIDALTARAEKAEADRDMHAEANARIRDAKNLYVERAEKAEREAENAKGRAAVDHPAALEAIRQRLAKALGLTEWYSLNEVISRVDAALKERK